jgi:hypothetical protein
VCLPPGIKPTQVSQVIRTFYPMTGTEPQSLKLFLDNNMDCIAVFEGQNPHLFSLMSLVADSLLLLLLFVFHYIYNRPRPCRYSNMSNSNLAIHIKQSSFGIKYTQLAYVWSKYNYA